MKWKLSDTQDEDTKVLEISSDSGWSSYRFEVERGKGTYEFASALASFALGDDHVTEGII